jgi:hypothetical protein
MMIPFALFRLTDVEHGAPPHWPFGSTESTVNTSGRASVVGSNTAVMQTDRRMVAADNSVNSDVECCGFQFPPLDVPLVPFEVLPYLTCLPNIRYQ